MSLEPEDNSNDKVPTAQASEPGFNPQDTSKMLNIVAHSCISGAREGGHMQMLGVFGINSLPFL